MDGNRMQLKTLSDLPARYLAPGSDATTAAGSGESAAAERERDVRLLARVAARDTAAERAFAALFDHHSPVVLGLLERMLGAGGEAEEVLQDVFLQIWRQAASYQPQLKTPRGWMLMLARSRALDRLRSSAARERREDRLQRESAGLTAPVGGDRLEAAEHRRRLAAALLRLPAEQRQAVELAFFHGLSHREIAARLGAPLGTVKSRVLLGLRKLHRLLVGAPAAPRSILAA
jgi:RNA polymerase sigma-70 factor, ECF subfamily